MGILAAGERCVSTTNRNFVGRMGHSTARSTSPAPATAAAGRMTGHITDREGGISMNARVPVFKYGDNIDTDVIIPARYLNTQSPPSWPATAWRTSTRTLSPRQSRATSWSPARTSAAAPRASMRPSPSRRPASAASSPRALPASSTATPSTSACHSGVPRRQRGHRRGRRSAVDFDTGVITTRPPGPDLPGRAVPAVYPEHHAKGGLMNSLKD